MNVDVVLSVFNKRRYSSKTRATGVARILEGAPTESVGTTGGWGSSVSRTGENHVSGIRGRAITIVGTLQGTGGRGGSLSSASLESEDPWTW